MSGCEQRLVCLLCETEREQFSQLMRGSWKKHYKPKPVHEREDAPHREQRFGYRYGLSYGMGSELSSVTWSAREIEFYHKCSKSENELNFDYLDELYCGREK